MDLELMKKRLAEVIEPMLKGNAIELVALDVLAGGHLIRILLDKTGGGINLDEVAAASRQISAVLETAGFSAEGYSLEVSSPGINRPLNKSEDFIRFSGRKVRIVTKEKIGNDRVFTGLLGGINGENIFLRQNEKEIIIELNNIRKANIDEDLL